MTVLLPWPVELAASTTLAAVGFAMATGILFGWYPARRAGRIDPIDALRFE